MEYKIGDKVVYPAHGVGIIEEVETRTISGANAIFYSLRIIDSDMKIMIPTGKCKSVGLRRVIERHDLHGVPTRCGAGADHAHAEVLFAVRANKHQSHATLRGVER